MQSAGFCASWVVAILSCVGFGACLDEPLPSSSSAAQLVVGWDPLGCGDPHRVAIDLEDDGGARLSGSTPCNLGRLGLGVAHLGAYHGRIYAWALDGPAGPSIPVDLTIDQPIVEWFVATPR
jgi:hypothetical protein